MLDRGLRRNSPRPFNVRHAKRAFGTRPRLSETDLFIRVALMRFCSRRSDPNLEPAYFHSQECFKKSWKEHKKTFHTGLPPPHRRTRLQRSPKQ